MRTIGAFFCGVAEFRQSITTHYDYPLIEAYDTGRELMHRLTFRFYDDSYP